MMSFAVCEKDLVRYLKENGNVHRRDLTVLHCIVQRLDLNLSCPKNLLNLSCSKNLDLNRM